MDQEDDQFFDDAEFPSLPVVVETGEVEVVEVEAQDDDADDIAGVFEPDVAAGVSTVENENRVGVVIPLPPRNPKRSTPNYRSEEVVTAVYVYIAINEEEQIQTM